MAYDMFLSPAVIRLSGPLHERLVWCLCQSGAKKKKKKKPKNVGITPKHHFFDFFATILVSYLQFSGNDLTTSCQFCFQSPWVSRGIVDLLIIQRGTAHACIRWIEIGGGTGTIAATMVSVDIYLGPFCLVCSLTDASGVLFLFRL